MNKMKISAKPVRIIGIGIAAAMLFAAPSLSIAEDTVQAPPSGDSQSQVTQIAQNTALAAPVADAMTQQNVAAPAPAPVAPAPAPAPVYKLKAKADGRSAINLKWSKVKGADGYTIYRSTAKNKRGSKIATIDVAKNRSFEDETAAIKTSYYYTVKVWEEKGGKRSTLATINSAKVKNKLNIARSLECKTYAYSGHTTTASGMAARVGRVAVDPRVIPLGTWLYVEGYGLCQAADTGGDIKGNTLDLFMNSNGECEQWGVRYKQVYVLE